MKDWELYFIICVCVCWDGCDALCVGQCIICMFGWVHCVCPRGGDGGQCVNCIVYSLCCLLQHNYSEIHSAG